LRPPTPPAPGEIFIKQDGSIPTAPAPPLVIRQQPPRPCTPEPLVIREAPPTPPEQVCRKVITISGKRVPPPPRKVIIERLAPLPSKPQSILIERWLPYAQVKRRVIFQKSTEAEVVCLKPRNVIIQWETPKVNIKKEFKYLGIIHANPAEYIQRYGNVLKNSRDLPQFVHDIKTPDGVVLASDYHYNPVHELEGDVEALKLVDLEREGLSEYREILARRGISYIGDGNVGEQAARFQSSSEVITETKQSISRSNSTKIESRRQSTSSNVTEVVNRIFQGIDLNHDGTISVDEAGHMLLVLNSRLDRKYGEDDLFNFVNSLDKNKDGKVDFSEFKYAFMGLL
jgi:hypothetical protein